VTIIDVLPLKATRCDAIANLKMFWAPGHQRLHFDDFIYIHHVAPHYSAGIVIAFTEGGRTIPVLLFWHLA